MTTIGAPPSRGGPSFSTGQPTIRQAPAYSGGPASGVIVGPPAPTGTNFAMPQITYAQPFGQTNQGPWQPPGYPSQNQTFWQPPSYLQPYQQRNSSFVSGGQYGLPLPVAPSSFVQQFSGLGMDSLQPQWQGQTVADGSYDSLAAALAELEALLS